MADVPVIAKEVPTTAIDVPVAAVEVLGANGRSIHAERGFMQMGGGALSILSKFMKWRHICVTVASQHS